MSEPTRVIDSHRHFWNRTERRYDWITPDLGILDADFAPKDVAAESAASGITGSILVQSADSYEDTFSMLSLASTEAGIDGVIGWVPLDRPAEARAALEVYSSTPVLRGVRALTHGYGDPAWILRDDVAETLGHVATLGLTLDYTAASAQGLDLVPELARQHSDLTIILDHLANPRIADGEWEPWAGQVARCAEAPNVVVKVSGLNTLSQPGWTVADWQPYVDYALERFGPKRAMLGSNWPVSLLSGDFASVWNALCATLSGLSTTEREELLHRTAVRSYSLAR